MKETTLKTDLAEQLALRLAPLVAAGSDHPHALTA